MRSKSSYNSLDEKGAQKIFSADPQNLLFSSVPVSIEQGHLLRQFSTVNLSKQPLTAILFFCLTAVVGAQMVKAGQQVEIRTDLGVIVVELDTASSPRTCAAFVSYIHQQVYQQSDFRQKDEGDIQGGTPGPQAKGYSRSGNFFQNAPPGEFKLKHVRGAIGLARTVGDCNPTKSSNSTQFYIMWKDQPADDGEYSIFGHVIRGMDVVDQIAATLGKDKAKPVRFNVVAL